MKVAIQVEEKIIYEEEYTIEQPDTMTDEEFDEIVAVAERNSRDGQAKDMLFVFEQHGLKILDQTDNFPNDPRSTEVEVVDVRNVKEQTK